MTAVVRWVESVVALPSPLGLRGAPIVICPCVGLRSTWFVSVFFFFFLRGEEGEYWKGGSHHSLYRSSYCGFHPSGTEGGGGPGGGANDIADRISSPFRNNFRWIWDFKR